MQQRVLIILLLGFSTSVWPLKATNPVSRLAQTEEVVKKEHSSLSKFVRAFCKFVGKQPSVKHLYSIAFAIGFLTLLTMVVCFYYPNLYHFLLVLGIANFLMYSMITKAQIHRNLEVNKWNKIRLFIIASIGILALAAVAIRFAYILYLITFLF